MTASPQPSKTAKDSSQLTRTEEKNALLQEALAQPGVRDALRVQGGWQEPLRVLQHYQEITREYPAVIATDHANFDPSRL